MGWFDDQQIAGFDDWVRNERNLGGTGDPGAITQVGGQTPNLPPGIGITGGTAYDPRMGGSPGQYGSIGGPTDPRFTEATGYNLPAPAETPFNQMQTGNNGYPLAAVAGQGLMAPFASGMQTPDWQTLSQNPAYQFRMDQGRQAIERGAAGRGTLLTGGTLKDLTAFGQGLASQEYSNEYDRARNMWLDSAGLFNQNQSNQFNRLSSLAGIGQQASGQTGQFGSSYANNAGDLITGAGNATAAGQIGSGNAWNSAINGISQNAMLAALMRRQ